MQHFEFSIFKKGSLHFVHRSHETRSKGWLESNDAPPTKIDITTDVGKSSMAISKLNNSSNPFITILPLLEALAIHT